MEQNESYCGVCYNSIPEKLDACVSLITEHYKGELISIRKIWTCSNHCWKQLEGIISDHN